jgi:hypothetical protein
MKNLKGSRIAARFLICRPKDISEIKFSLDYVSLVGGPRGPPGSRDERDQPRETFFSGLQNSYADSLIVPGDSNRFSGAALVREESYCQVSAWLDGLLPLPAAISSRFVGARGL